MAGILKRIFKQGDRHQPGRCTFVIAAAGISERMKGQNKLFALVGGVPILARTLIAIEKCEMVSEIIVVTRSEDLVNVSELCRDFSISKVTKIVCGGQTRLESVLIGVSEVSPRAKLIGVHDGARPFITSSVIMKTIKAADEFGAAAPAVPVSDTMKNAQNNFVTSTLPRDQLFIVQTPQIFLPELIKGALQNAAETKLNITDDCMAVEAIGAAVALTEGSPENIKITTPIDLAFADAIVQMRRDLQ